MPGKQRSQEDEEDGNSVDDARKQALKEETVDELRRHFRDQHGIAELYLISCQQIHSAFDFDQLHRCREGRGERADREKLPNLSRGVR